MNPGPREEYEARLRRRLEEAERAGQHHIAIGNARLVVVIAGVILVWLAVARHIVAVWWLGAPAAIFAALAIVHARILRRQARAKRAVRFYEKGLSRLDGKWAGEGEDGSRFDDPAHPYADDLDLFGKGSLFELLSTARLRTGEETLADWLLRPSSAEVVRARHSAIEELRPRLALREDMALLGEDLRSGIQPALLVKWAERPLVFRGAGLRITASVLALLAVAAVAVWAVAGVPEFFLGVLVAEYAFALRLRSRVKQVLETVGEPAYGLALFAEVLARIEREPLASPRLRELRGSLDTAGLPPSRRIARLNRLMELVDSGEHLLVKRIIGPPLVYHAQLAFAIEAWRARCGLRVRQWLAAAGEFEALLSLAGYSFEHPDDVFPEFVEPACFEGEGLAHPFLPEDRAVRNDVRLGDPIRVLVVSGSNMSGKSTLLRTTGINAVLAMAGAPVRARRLRLSQLRVGASIRTLDSLQGGTSRFYAEIKRIRSIIELAKDDAPLLFLLDELLQGTNSHDRRIGAEAVIRVMVARGAIGLLTTHDLALAHIAEVLSPQAANVHFEDHLEGGRITFDYRLRDGTVRKSNALELMRSIGLEV